MNYAKRIFSIFILFIISQIGITAFGVIKQLSLDAGEKNLNISSTLVTVILVVINILFLIYLAKRMNIIKTNHPFLTKKNILIILVATLIDRGIAIGGTLLLNMQGHTTTANDSTLIKLFSGVSPVLVVLLLGIAAPIMEEIVFRGGIIGYLVENNALLAILISSFLFGIIHGPTNFISFGMYFFMGIILSVSYYKTKDLRVSISIHFLNNLFPAIAIAYSLI
ncbi:CPBP family intramembrane metalloprotease [Enterococcus faecalis]|nr:CPBP family intramembrane glutamic endopeptidase [Enterococcus faecalis]EFM69390.1 CAAX amino terminal protease family protein [Enterococcus faecalis TX0109]EFT90381.1 CAAX amino terminal protease family protein [Enterococcus faecalis TX4244]EGO2585355.1 CPBP family intramembrane metalloprotease [Enterococcus faecalis]EGO2590809.1 CPBP family intramembrane metalloprotease [Enterococcus faecalis]EGO2601591.1 CPBP family intramembrane metalloprotease [Enterococcus faecalis]